MSSFRQDIKQAFPGGRTERAALRLVESLRSSVGVCLSSAGLVIKAGGSPLVKAGAAFYAMAGSRLVTKAINTDMAALSGTVSNGAFNVFCFFVDRAGTLETFMGTEGASLATVKFPKFHPSKACIGFVIINPTGTGDFVGGTTALDSGTVVPGAVYVNTPFPFRPSPDLYLEE